MNTKQLDLFYASDRITVYLIHLSRPVGKSQHYIGSTDNLTRRLKQHSYKRKKGGSPLLREANKRNILWYVAQTWHASRAFEMKLKQQKHARRFCPFCNGADTLEIPF
jgi:predicted GIY-YIG superfamily endonuclease